ncbi:MAG: DUF6209 family protein [Kofleriaceae bacterium]
MRLALFALVALVAVFAGCVAAPAYDSTSQAPLVGVNGSQDQADHGCNVVLRGLQRSGNGTGGYATNGDSWIWTGAIEISNAAATEGLTPAALYQAGSDPSWHEVATVPSSQPATPGYTRFDVALDQGLPGPGMSSTAITSAKIQVVPLLHLAQGGRLFDHNRNPGATANYVMTYPDLAVGPDATVCAPEVGPTHANFVFDADFTQHRDGVFAPGGEVSIVYATSRLALCEATQGGLPQYDITAWVKFLPGNQLTAVSVRDGAPAIAVPTDARQAEVWFETTSVYGCHAFDSNFGSNYTFDAMLAPQWIGNGTTLLTRDDSAPCGGGPVTSGFTYDTWVRQRATITNTCVEVYQPGMTDHDDPDLWQKLDAELHVQTAPQTWQVFPIGFESRVGNNARFAFDWRGVDPFRAHNCPQTAVAPTTDGMYVQTQLAYYVTVNGGEYRPAPGAAFAGTFVDYPNDAWRAANCN